MKNQILLISLMLGLMLNTSGQTIDLTFTAVDNESYIQLDSIKVMNRTQGGDTVLSWPDTVLSLFVVGFDELQVKESAFQVFQNYPNPVVDQTIISFYIPSKGQVGFMITDMLGRVIVKDDRVLDKGIHSLRFTPGERNLYFFTAEWHSISSSINILQNTNHSGGQGSLEYLGSDASTIEMKEIVATQSFNFNIGDELLYIGYTGTLQSGMLDAPE
jgi:hypothetical protein